MTVIQKDLTLVFAVAVTLADGMPREVVLQHACHKVVLQSQKPEDFKEAKLRQIINEKQQPEGHYLSSAAAAGKTKSKNKRERAHMHE